MVAGGRTARSFMRVFFWAVSELASVWIRRFSSFTLAWRTARLQRPGNNDTHGKARFSCARRAPHREPHRAPHRVPTKCLEMEASFQKAPKPTRRAESVPLLHRSRPLPCLPVEVALWYPSRAHRPLPSPDPPRPSSPPASAHNWPGMSTRVSDASSCSARPLAFTLPAPTISSIVVTF